MGLLKTLSDQGKSIISVADKYKGTPGKIKSAFDKDKKKAVVVSEKITREEYAKRYNNLRAIASVSAMLSVVALIMMPFSESFFRLVFTIAASLWFGMLYYRYAFRMWAARQEWLSWRRIKDGRIYEQKDFIEALSSNPSDFLPMALSKKRE